MQILYLLRTQPDETVQKMMKHLTNGDLSKEIKLFEENVDWSKLVDEIMEADQVVSWW